MNSNIPFIPRQPAPSPNTLLRVNVESCLNAAGYQEALLMFIQVCKEKSAQWEQADPPQPEQIEIWQDRINMLQAAADRERQQEIERQGDPEDLSGLDFELPNPDDCDEEDLDEI